MGVFMVMKDLHFRSLMFLTVFGHSVTLTTFVHCKNTTTVHVYKFNCVHKNYYQIKVNDVLSISLVLSS